MLILLPAWWHYREKPAAAAIAAMLIGFTGFLLIVIPNGFGVGALLSITYAAAVTVGILLARRIRVEPLALAAWQFLIGGTVLAVAAFLVDGSPTIRWTPVFVASLLCTAVLASHSPTSPGFRKLAAGDWIWAGISFVIAALVILVVANHRRSAESPHPGTRE